MTRIDNNLPLSPSNPLGDLFQPEKPRLQAANTTVGESSARSAESVHHRPQLEPPARVLRHGPTEIQFLELMEEFRAFGDDMLILSSSQLEAFKEKLKTLNLEHVQKIKETAERAQASDFWSLLQKAASCILSAISIVLGISLIGTGGGALIGGAMIASGILSISNFALTESGSWDWIVRKLARDEEQRRFLQTVLPAAVGITCALVSIGSSAGLALFAPEAFTSQISMIAQGFLGLFQGTTTIGKGISDSRLIWSQADLTELAAHMYVTQEKVKAGTHRVEELIKTMQGIQQAMAQLIASAAQANQIVVKNLQG